MGGSAWTPMVDSFARLSPGTKFDEGFDFFVEIVFVPFGHGDDLPAAFEGGFGFGHQSITAVKHRQLNSRLIPGRPLDPMPFVRRDVDEITRPHLHRLIVSFKQQLRLPFQHDDPFVLILIVPEVIGTGVAVGDDAFDADRIGLCQDFGQFLGEVGGEGI